MVFDKRRRLDLGKDIASEGYTVPGIANCEDKNKKPIEKYRGRNLRFEKR